MRRGVDTFGGRDQARHIKHMSLQCAAAFPREVREAQHRNTNHSTCT